QLASPVQIWTWDLSDGSFRRESRPPRDVPHPGPARLAGIWPPLKEARSPEYVATSSGPMVASGATVTVRKAKGGESVVVWRGEESECRALQFGADPRSLFIATDRRVLLIDVASGLALESPLGEGGIEVYVDRIL